MADTPISSGRKWLRRCWRGLRLILIAYLAIIVLLMLLENYLIFRPTPASRDWLPPGSVQAQDVDLTSRDGTAIHAWWCPLPDAEEVVFYCHGNAGNLSYRRGAVAEWHQHFGQSVLIFDYPGFGKSAGSPTEDGCYAAAEAAFDWLTETQGVPAERIIIYGKSLGGGVAVELATRRPHRALVLAKTFTSLPDMAQKLYPWLPARWLTRAQFNNLEKIGRCPRPVFITHGDRDWLIPFAMGERLHEAATAAKQFLPLPGVNHDASLPPEFYANLKQFLATVESPRAAD